MPVYEYQCKNCGQVEEAFQKISEPPLESCSQCKGHLKKIISQSTFHLKGSGWYVTDYGGKKAGVDTREKSTTKPIKSTSDKYSDSVKSSDSAK
ncbi:MAG: zinc ribbon domain-containing protein [Desulfobacteraceae bacterium]|nr:zinc ribbon domain-containing protein [Desulfobacteraceae bacterium]